MPAGCVRLRVCTCKRIGTALSDGTAGGTGLFRASVACARLCASAHRMVVCGRGGVVRFSFSVVFVRERPQSSSCERSRLRFPELTPRPRCHIHPAEVDPSSDRPSPAPRVDLSLATWPIAQRLIQSASRHVPGAVPSRRPSGQCSSPPSVCDHPVRVPFVVLSCLRFIVLACYRVSVLAC